jgi:hypothetical protein
LTVSQRLCYLSKRLKSRSTPSRPADLLATLKVITGFNTDIEFQGKVYHVQTEDKGLARPVVMTLVYDRGTILASKRTPYDDLIASGLDEDVLSERLQKQHRTICAAIRAGRIEDLKRMSEKDAARAPEPGGALAGMPVIPKPEGLPLDIPLDGFISDPTISGPIPKPAVHEELDLLSTTPEPEADDYAIIEADVIVPDDAVMVVSEMSGRDRPANSKLAIELLGANRFRSGDSKIVTFLVCRGSQSKVVAEAKIMVKLLGSSFRPVIFHTETDKNGIASLQIHIPNFTEGRAALLARAVSDGEEVELRRVITQK